MAAVSSLNSGETVTSSRTRFRNTLSSVPCGRKTMPGFVQNWPAPSVKEPCSPSAIASPRSRNAPGRTKTGLVLLISAKNGIGSGRDEQRSISALPAAREPVKPPAFTSGCFTSADPMREPGPNSSEKAPSGSPHSRTLSRTACPTSSPVPGWAAWHLTMTGFPAANADAVSPPATENANGKLLAPNTTTGPSGRKRERTSGLGSGLRSGSARSIRAASHEPSSTT